VKQQEFIMAVVRKIISIAFWIVSVFGASLSVAQSPSASELYDALHMDILVDVIVSEGRDQVRDAAEIYLTGRAAETYVTENVALYDPDEIRQHLIDGLSSGLSADDLAVAVAFFKTETGAYAAKLEASARQAISDQGVEDHAKAMASDAVARGVERIDILETAIADMDLVEMNLAGAMTAQYQFLMPLSDVKDLGLDQAAVLTMIQEGQDALSQSILEWLVAFLYMAYAPLDDEQLSTYLTYQTSPNGASLNKVLFDVFNAIDRDMSAAMGVSLAQSLQSKEI
jgi:hypothetical protein